MSGALPERIYDEEGNLANAAEMAAAMLAATPDQSRFSINEEALEKLLDLAGFCAEKGIALTIVLPPMEQSVRALVCEPLGIDEAMQPALAALEDCGALVLDYEWANDPAWPDTMFYDGFHIDTVHGLPTWTEILFSEVA